jgi:hypothetical protein
LEVKPSGTPDRAAVEWLRAAMNATALPPGAVAAEAPSGNNPQRVSGASGASGVSGVRQTMGERILKSMRSTASDISTSWQQADALSTGLQQRSFADSGYMRDLIDLQRKNAVTYVHLDILSKTVGKAVYTIDSLGRS